MLATLLLAGPGQKVMAFAGRSVRPLPPRAPQDLAPPQPTAPAPTRRQRRNAPGRQTACDKKWEGRAWISPETLASNINKRARKRASPAGDSDDDALALPEATYLQEPPPPPDAPPKPEDPVPYKDPASRRRDKDRIPSSETWFWRDTQWVLLPRPVAHEAGPFRAYLPLPEKQLALLAWLVEPARVRCDGMPPLDLAFLGTHLVPRLNRVHPVSLRLLNWLVVDYSQELGTAYKWTCPGSAVSQVVVVHTEYVQWLSRWGRRHYDVFRRRHRIYFTLPDGETYSTTVAQVHFFYMAHLYGFLEFAEQNTAAIEEHMKRRLVANADKKSAAATEGRAFQRRPLVQKSAPGAFMVSKGSVVVRLGGPPRADADYYDDFGDGEDLGDEDAM
jgi:hypothetical protein